MPYEPPPEIASLSITEIGELIEQRKLPPVESWDPQNSGDSEMIIKRDGSWLHQGSPIHRKAMVRAFSSILRREDDGSYVLVTPYQKLTIEVEDAPFVAVDITSEGTGKDRELGFRLNTDDLVVAGADHALSVTEQDGAPAPYLHVRGGLKARINRAVFYELAEMAIAEQEDHPDQSLGLWSSGTFFAFENEK